jgi:hypothetical protein
MKSEPPKLKYSKEVQNALNNFMQRQNTLNTAQSIQLNSNESSDISAGQDEI